MQSAAWELRYWLEWSRQNVRFLAGSAVMLLALAVFVYCLSPLRIYPGRRLMVVKNTKTYLLERPVVAGQVVVATGETDPGIGKDEPGGWVRVRFIEPPDAGEVASIPLSAVRGE